MRVTGRDATPKPTTTAPYAITPLIATLSVDIVPAQGGNLTSCPCVDVRGGSRTAPTSRHPERTPNPQTNDNCPLRHSPAGCYIVHIRPSREGGDPLALWERAGVRVRKGMRRNATKCN